tara:strand:+ start:1164 stop:2390 length:1227 start_codon:yes stop_codon:yes gene_type:complete
MCGIVGLYNNKISKEELHKKISFANESQLHRGPDGSGIYLSDSLSFTMGMTRLAILDFKNGNQPFFSRDRKYCLTFNGEIINSKELRKELEAKKYQFKSDNSDTEVLLYLLIQEREKCLSKINGMFSFCFFDIENKKILISRDRFGIKPLYYFYKNNVLGFASELKTLKVLFDEPIDINKESLSDFLSLMYIPSPKTIYKNIYKLCPGELIKFDLINSQFIKIKWSEHKFQPDKKLDEKSSQEGLKFYVDEAIKKWTLSDVPVSNSLSGGLDSSIISSVLGKNKFKLHNFTLGFSSKEDTKFDEIDLAKLVSKKFDQKHTLIQLNHENLLNDLDRILEDIHEPYGGGLPSWFVYKSVSKKYKVCFNGTGIDEFFGSYGKWNKLDGIFIKKVSYERFKKYFFDSLFNIL